MKKLVLLVAIASLPACVGPPALTVASLALSGISYVETGKTLPDHALSSVSQRDCIVFRAAQGEQICQDPSAEGGLAETVVPAPTVVAAAPVPEVTVAALVPAPVAPPAEQRAEVRRERQTSPGHDGYRAVLWGPPPVAATARGTDPALNVPTVSPPIAVVPSPGRDTTMPAAAKPTSKSTAMAVTVPSPPSAERPRYRLVVGSFRDRERAALHIARLEVPGLDVVTATVDGRTQYRVVSGPVTHGELAQAKRVFTDRGVNGAWAIRDKKEPAIQLASR